MSINLLLIVVFFGMLFLGVPIFMAIGLAIIACVSTGQIFDYINIVSGLCNSADNFPLIAVPFFILAGEFMSAGGVSRRIVDFANSQVGHMRGGLGMVTVLSCMFFSALSGSGVATCAAIGGFMIPTMIEQKYDRGYAAALTATASSLGPIIPPSISFILFAIILNVSVTQLFAAGILPGILIGLSLMIVNYIIARKRGYPTGPRASFKEKLATLNRTKWSLCVPIVILGGIYGGVFSPTEAAIIATDISIILGLFVYKEFTIKDIPNIVIKALKSTGIALSLLGFAVVFGRVMVIADLPNTVSNWVMSVTNSKVAVLLIVNLILLIVGCLMETSSAVIITSPILWAIVKQFGVDPIHFGVILVCNLCIGLATPPVGQSLFVASSISGAKVSEIVKPMLPLLIAAFTSQLIITFVPWLSLAIPHLIR
ncbi:MAG: TRAP transporter large permease [Lutisporaceae bacterium]|jgi:C4-dicarboxylate transporter DctM subunit